MPASGVLGPKQSRGFFVLTSTMNSTFALKQVGKGGSGGSYLPGTMSAAAISSGGFSTGTLLKDMGKTVVSSSHTFRKVQRVVTGGPSIADLDPLNGSPFYMELNVSQSLQTPASGNAFPFVAYRPETM
jgi:hypothetical protein